jgi:F-type H+-transporting ATPase subunit epsilon
VAKLRVELVSPERELWSGEADMVIARTLDGEIGILPGHSPVLGVMVDGSVVRIKPAEGEETISAMVSGGFLSVASDEVSLLAEYANAAREEYERASGEDGDEAAAAQRRARARLRAAGQEV